VLRAKEHASTPYSFDVFTLDLHLNLSRSLGTHHKQKAPKQAFGALGFYIMYMKDEGTLNLSS